MKPFGITMGGNVYQLIAEVPNWSADIPNSLINYRNFFKITHAGLLFSDHSSSNYTDLNRVYYFIMEQAQDCQ